VLRHNVVGDHPAGFADVELMRPAARFGELVLAEPPGAYGIANVLRHARMIREGPEEPLLVAYVFGEYLFARRVIGFRPSVIRADEIRGDSEIVIDVGL